jgi:hypothetical protein
LFFRIKYFAIKKVIETEARTLDKTRENPQSRFLPIPDEPKQIK